MVRQISWFLIAGGSAAAVEFLSFLLFMHVLHMNLLFANATSFCLGLITSFLLNRQWTFLSRQGGGYEKRAHHQFLQYCVLAGVNLLFMTGFVSALHALGVMVALAKLLGMVMIAAWNFVLYRKIIFKSTIRQLIG